MNLITAVENFIRAKRYRLSVSHCFVGLLIQIPVTLLFGSLCGAVAVVSWYWSRKKIEIEALHGHDIDPVSTWAIGWFPWQWDLYRQLDLYCPIVSATLFAIIFNKYAANVSLF